MAVINIPATIAEQVEEGKSLEISYRVLHSHAYLNNNEDNTTIRFPFTSIIHKYRNLLSHIIINMELTDAEQYTYQFKPKLLSEEVYGTTEFWDILLILNNCKSVIDFKPKVVKLYDPDKFKAYLNEILIIEENML